MSIANELITRGWYQGDYEGPDGSVCLAGALCHATDSSTYGNEPLSACDVLVRVIGLNDRSNIAAWNDAPGRTFDEVLRVAKEADEILDAQP